MQTIGYMGSRTQPARYGSQYHHLQAATGYVHPNSQNVREFFLEKLPCDFVFLMPFILLGWKESSAAVVVESLRFSMSRTVALLLN